MINYKNMIFLAVLCISLTIIGCGGGGGGSNPAATDIASGDTANLTGVVMMSGQPLANASVFLYKSDRAHTAGFSALPSIRSSLNPSTAGEDGMFSTTSDDSGNYSFLNVPLGEYTLIAMKDEKHQFAQTGILLSVRAQTTTQNAQLTPTGKISGKVVTTISGTSQNVPAATVYVAGTSYVAITDLNGDFTINHVPSNPAPATAYSLQVVSNMGFTSRSDVRVEPGITNNLGNLSVAVNPQQTATINGQIAGTTGNPAITAKMVFVSSLDGKFFNTAHTSTTGAFAVAVPRTGQYSVRVIPEMPFIYNPGSQQVNVAALGTTVTIPTSFTPTQTQNQGMVNVSSMNLNLQFSPLNFLGFEVYDNYGYFLILNGATADVSKYNMNNGNWISSYTFNISAGHHPTIGVSGDGVFISLRDDMGVDKVRLIGHNMSMIRERVLTAVEFGFNSPTFHSVKVFNNKLYMLTTYGTNSDEISLAEVNSNLDLVSNYNFQTPGVSQDNTTAAMAYDMFTNTVYLAHDEMSGDFHIKSFANANLGSIPDIIILSSTPGTLSGLHVANRKIFKISTSSVAVIDAMTGFTIMPAEPVAAVGNDQNGRVWFLYNLGTFSLQTPHASLLNSLGTNNSPPILKKTQTIKLDSLNGMTYLLYQTKDYQMAVYKYNSNF